MMNLIIILVFELVLLLNFIESILLNPKSELCECPNVQIDLKNNKKYRIINSTLVPQTDLKWVVNLHYRYNLGNKTTDPKSKGYFGFCSGVVLNENYILTTAECFVEFKEDLKTILNRTLEQKYKDGEFYVSGGAGHDINRNYFEDSQYRKIKNYTFHPKYDLSVLSESDSNYNYALVELESPLILGNSTGIYPACLSREIYVEPKTDLIAAGYGNPELNNKTIMDKSRSVDFEFHGTGTNLRMTSIKYNGNCYPTIKNIMCILPNYENICDGDLGGPLMWYDSEINKLFTIGLLSMQQNVKDKARCDSENPIYANDLFEAIIWIKDRIGKNLCLITKRIQFHPDLYNTTISESTEEPVTTESVNTTKNVESNVRKEINKLLIMLLPVLNILIILYI